MSELQTLSCFCQMIASHYVLYLKVTLSSSCNISELGTVRWDSKLLDFWELGVLLMSFYLLFVIKRENKAVFLMVFVWLRLFITNA